jgi:simple sugar transport system substrate-binding protein
MHKSYLVRVLFVLVVLTTALSACVAPVAAPAAPAAAAPAAQSQPAAQAAAPAAPAAAGDKWCSGIKIRYFVGGEAGDAFASIVYKGAQAAQADTGADVEYVFSGWQPEKMVSQLRDAVAAKPDGIAMMGHPGDDAIMPLAADANKAGILMMYQNVDVPKVRAKYGGGYVGANLTPQGRALGEEAVRQFGLKSGDQAIVFGAWDQPGRYLREEGTAKYLEEQGLKVERITGKPEWASDPNLMIPTITAAVLKLPETKVIVYSGGQQLGAVPVFMDALKKKPGDIINIGFDTSPAVIDGFKKGFVQLTADQQPFMQGYVPILSLCMSKKYGLGPMNLDTGAGFVDAKNYQGVAEWATKGYR